MADTARIVTAAMSLRQIEPQLWEEFVEAVRIYGAEMLRDTLRAPPDMVLRAQGMAIAANDIATVLRTAPEQYERMQRGRDGRKENEWRG